MLKFIFFIFFFVIVLCFLAGFSIIRTIRDALFGPPSGARNSKQHRTTGKNTSRGQTHASAQPRKKIFRKDEGEYTDYEEVK
ncbi:MAG: DUF4834 family protein [Tannerellaceae bacterium]|jgi:hypothetical protein|nr:DUF4834 family protein [Tannerellaceae bacterium]